MFHPAYWCGLWFSLTVVCGCGARALGRRHRDQAYDKYTNEAYGLEYGSDDDSLLYLDTDAEAL